MPLKMEKIGSIYFINLELYMNLVDSKNFIHSKTLQIRPEKSIFKLL